MKRAKDQMSETRSNARGLEPQRHKALESETWTHELGLENLIYSCLLDVPKTYHQEFYSRPPKEISQALQQQGVVPTLPCKNSVVVDITP
jgi:hypothetical protein